MPDELERIFRELESIRGTLRDMTASITANLSAHSTSIGRLEEKLTAHVATSELKIEAVDVQIEAVSKDLNIAFAKIKDLEAITRSLPIAINDRFKVYEDLQSQAKGAARLWRLIAGGVAAAAAMFEFWAHYGGGK